ncbi:hypothetical protein CBF30_04210 [Vagococcus entomophilus]|uniref:Uncharacterized protein n=1 Tax=Vagococcus entomophilus TaxID=1160095 RepID=A0A430AK23_9ENTE|nr:hypothetical protein CBF30_04210 [Vagococcus entomophilus]
MCEYCSFDDTTGIAKQPFYRHCGGWSFLEKVENQYQLTSYRVNDLEYPYTSFVVNYCPICGRELNK